MDNFTEKDYLDHIAGLVARSTQEMSQFFEMMGYFELSRNEMLAPEIRQSFLERAITSMGLNPSDLLDQEKTTAESQFVK